MRVQGRITDWRDEKGFGFIVPFGGGDRVFFHISSMTSRSRRPVLYDRVVYTLEKDERGRPRAADVALIVKRQAAAGVRKPGATVIVVAAAFLALVAALVAGSRLPLAVGVLYAVMSIVAYGAYRFDKSAARAGRWRTRESTLHALDLFGGWPGGLVARHVHRHKSKKGSFRVTFWITVVVNVAAMLWLLTTDGQSFLAELDWVRW